MIEYMGEVEVLRGTERERVRVREVGSLDEGMQIKQSIDGTSWWR